MSEEQKSYDRALLEDLQRNVGVIAEAQEALLKRVDAIEPEITRIGSVAGVLEASARDTHNQLRRVDTRLVGIESRLDTIDTRLDAVDARLERMETSATDTQQRLERMETSATDTQQRLERMETSAIDSQQRLERMETSATDTQQLLKRIAGHLQTGGTRPPRTPPRATGIRLTKRHKKS